LTIPPQSTASFEFNATPDSVGYYDLPPALVHAGGAVVRSPSRMLRVVCEPNGTCDADENHVFCPQDCETGMQDGTCDMVDDGRNDPDCDFEIDPDFAYKGDTDGDGVINASDACPLTALGAKVDTYGCSCSQKICDDQDAATIDGCSEVMTPTCVYTPDTDQDGISDSTDNCPLAYNPGQTDSDSDGTGDQCEIGEIDSDTTLPGGTYEIDDPDLGGAIVITASNVTLDCAGAVIKGAGSGYGIYVPPVVSNVTIQNCTVRNYQYGIYLDTSSNNTLTGNTLEANGYGLLLGSSYTNTITGNVANSNTYVGLYLEGSAGNQVTGNTVNSNDGLGLFIHTSSNNDVSQNRICFNPNADFYVHDSTNTGDENSCNDPGGWNDAGTTGCTSACTSAVYLPVILRPME
jgi:parallel beta-helix repeat protein